MPAPGGDADCPCGVAVRANLLGPFSVTVGARTVGPWPRPSAKRLLELLFISPGRRTGRGGACEALFPHLGPAAAARELSKALSMARATLSRLGTEAAGLIQADRTHIWADPGTPLEIDVESQGERIRSALKSEPGVERDNKLVLALADEGTLLEDEPVAEWAVRPRERLEWDRQEARLALARDRGRGKGRSQPEAVIEAWASCLAHEPTSEEAASALIGVYGAQRRHALVDATYDRCRSGLEELGLRISPALKEVYAAATAATELLGSPEDPVPRSASRYKEERRLVSVLFAELSGPVGVGVMSDPEDVRQVLGGALAGVIAEVEGLGGTVTSVSGAGLAALFGAPAAHEDDPERAVRAGSRILSAIGAGGLPPRPGALSARVGIETGPAVVGLLVAGVGYGALGEVVSAAAAVQSAARAGSVLVGPVTRAATEGTFEWGPTEDVAATPGAKPFVASYLERPRARSPGYRGHARLAGRAPWWAVRPSWTCSTRRCAKPRQGRARSSFWWASRAWARPAWCRNAVNVSWPGSEPAPAGCRCGWKAAVPPTRPRRRMVCTSSSCPPGRGPPPKKARRWPARLWSGP